MRQPGARRQDKRRQGMVELAFADLKGIQNETRFRRFGLVSARAEHAIHCAVHNIRRAAARSQAGRSQTRRPAAAMVRMRQNPTWRRFERMSR